MAKIHKVSDVYGITRDLPINYVTRPAVDEALVEALTRNQHLVIYGSSKQGKTSLRKYNLKDEEYIVITASNRWTLGQLHAAILKQAGYTVVQSETKTVSGSFKISVTARLTAKLFGTGLDASTAAEGTKSTSAVETHLELDPADVNDVIDALDQIVFKSWIVLEDFHYLPEETQRDFAVALKAFHESSELTFIIVGVWLQENRLVQFNGDLSGRVATINADLWSPLELTEAITVGERLLNIQFDKAFKNELVSASFDSIYVVQEVCSLACEQSGIVMTQDELTVVRPAGRGRALIAEVVERQSARFSDFILNFSAGFGSTDLEMYKWLLVPVIATSAARLEKGIPYRRIRRILGRVHPRGTALNAGNVTQALKGTASLQVQQGVKPLVLDYDQSLKRLNVVDRSFLIWLDQQIKSELLEAIDLGPDVLALANQPQTGSAGVDEEEEE